jgi:hypothetical protein
MPNGNRITLLHPSGEVGLSVAERTGVDLWSGKRHAQNRQSCDLRHIVRDPEGAENLGLGEHSSRRGPVWPELPWPEVREARAPRPQHRLLYQHFEAPSGHVTALLRVRTPLAARRHGGRHDPLTPRRSAGSGSRTYFPSLPGKQPHPTLGCRAMMRNSSCLDLVNPAAPRRAPRRKGRRDDTHEAQTLHWYSCRRRSARRRGPIRFPASERHLIY